MSRKSLVSKRREQIINGLYKSIVKKGFMDTSISDISRHSKVVRGIIHYYFKNKDEILSELMRSLSRSYITGMKKYISRFNDPVDKLNAFVDYHLLINEKTLYGRTGVWIEYWGRSLRDREVNKIIFELQNEIRSYLSTIITEGMNDGVFLKGKDNAVSAILLAIIEGTMLQWRVNKESVNLNDVYSEIKKIINIFKKKGDYHGKKV